LAQAEVLTRAARPPDHVFPYGPRDDQVADLWLPLGQGSGRPLVVFLHGGFWRSAYDRRHTRPLAEGLAAAGYAVCTPEFRRTGQPGGGWPGTFDDIAAAVDAVPGLAAEAAARGAVDPGRVVLAGHSAGGHLALWAAGRHRLPADSPWHTAPAAESGVAGVVSLAGVCDLAACYRLGLDGGAARDLMGGDPDGRPGEYAAADPMGLVPVGVRVALVHGTADQRVPESMSVEYRERAAGAGDSVRLSLLPGCGHFEVIDPLSEAWSAVLEAFGTVAG
jgi:acetyl esterase/lipase